MKKDEYQRYLASREWAILKAAVRERAGGACERCCYGEMESTHHITYANVGNESLDDLLGVCGGCHAFLSGVSDVDPVEESIQSIMEFYYSRGQQGEGDDRRAELALYRQTRPRPLTWQIWLDTRYGVAASA